MRIFSTRIYSETTAKRKPNPAPLQHALQRMRIAADSAVYVGDAPQDIEMARRAGVFSIAIPGPFPTHDRLRKSRPDALLESLAMLPEFLAEFRADGLDSRRPDSRAQR
jgi:phosphoglycolate phosphatase